MTRGRRGALLLGLLLSAGLVAGVEAISRTGAASRLLAERRIAATEPGAPPDSALTDRVAGELDLTHLDTLGYEPPRRDGPITRADLDYTSKLPKGYRSPAHRLTPSRTTRSVVSFRDDGAPLYDVTYTIDEHARRRTTPPAATPTSNIVVIGGSFTFGEGVEDDETLPSQLARLLPDAEVFNLGIHGEGPSHALRSLEQPSLLRNGGIPPRPGVAVYVFIDHHMERVLPRLGVLRGRAGMLSLPAYTEEDGELRYRGPYYRYAPLRSFGLLLLSHSHLLRELGVDFPSRWGPEQFRLVAATVEAMQRASAERFGTGRLYFVTWPGASGQYGAAVAAAIRAPEVEVVDLHRIDIQRLTRGRAFHPGDGHPTPLAHAVAAQLVARAIERPGAAR